MNSIVPGIGKDVNGARRWINLGPIQLQPSELAKWAAVLFLIREGLLMPGETTSATQARYGDEHLRRHGREVVLPAVRPAGGALFQSQVDRLVAIPNGTSNLLISTQYFRGSTFSSAAIVSVQPWPVAARGATG